MLFLIYFLFIEVDMGNYVEKVFNYCFKGSDLGIIRKGYFMYFYLI